MAVSILAVPALAQQPPAVVQTDEVRVETVGRSEPVLGRLVALQEGTVAARVSGPVAEVLVRAGDRVEQGDLLARLDAERLSRASRLAEAERAAVESELRAAEQQVELVQQEIDRLLKLEDSAAFNRARLDDARKELAVASSQALAAQARLERAAVALEVAQADIDDAEVTAPYPGVVVQRLVSPGEHVQVGSPLVRLVDDLHLEVEADVPTRIAAGLQPGAAVTVEFEDDSRAEASVRAVVPVESTMTRTRAVRFSLPDDVTGEDGNRAVGENVRAVLPVGGEDEAATVAKDAVNMGQGRPMVFVVQDDDTVAPRPIEIGAAQGGRFVVLSGLQPGEVVVTRGNERLRPGQAVSTGPSGNGAPAPAGGEAAEAEAAGGEPDGPPEQGAGREGA